MGVIDPLSHAGAPNDAAAGRALERDQASPDRALAPAGGAAPEPRLRFERVHARDDAGPKGGPRGSLTGLTLALGPGVHAILGAPEDGTMALIEIAAGARAPLRGKVLVDGREPGASPETRARIGSIGVVAELPDASSVRSSVELAMRARGELSPRAEAILGPLGLGPLLDRRSRSLRYVEMRAVELALALTTPAPLVVALYEPLVDVALQPLAKVRDRVRELALAGACVLVITSSPADAISLADRVHVLQRGLVLPSVLGEDSSGLAPGAVAELIVWVRDPDASQAGVRELAAALSARPEARAVAWEEHRGAGPGGSSVRVRTDSVEACSSAVLEAALQTGAVIDAMAPVTPGLAEVRAAASTLFARRYGRMTAATLPVITSAAQPAELVDSPAGSVDASILADAASSEGTQEPQPSAASPLGEPRNG